MLPVIIKCTTFPEHGVFESDQASCAGPLELLVTYISYKSMRWLLNGEHSTCAMKRRQWLGEKMHGVRSWGREIMSSNPSLVQWKTPNFIVGVRRKLNVNEQLQTFPYPTVSKPFLCCNNFMVKSCTQTLSDKQNEQKNLTFLAALATDEIQTPPNLAWNPNPTKLGMVI